MDESQVEAFIKSIKDEATISVTSKGTWIKVFVPFEVKPEKKKELQVVEYSAEAVGTAQVLAMYIDNANPQLKPRVVDAKWHKDMQFLLNSYDGDTIAAVMRFTYRNDRDTFWRGRILSAAKFRKQFETLLGQLGTAKQKGWI